MKTLFTLILALLSPLALLAQFSTSVKEIAPGGMAFFTKAQSGRLNDNSGGKAAFGGYDEVHALLVPQAGMGSIPVGENRFLVEIWLDDALPTEVTIELPPPGPQHSALAIPLYPNATRNVLPALAATFDAIFAAPSFNATQHWFRIKVYLVAGRRYLAEGGFSTDAGFMGNRFAEADKNQETDVVSVVPDAATQTYVTDELARDYGHLRLRTVVLAQAWAEEKGPSTGTWSCVVRYQVQDAAGRCYSGETRLERKVKKNGEEGKIKGELWPNRRGDCG